MMTRVVVTTMLGQRGEQGQAVTLL